MFKQEQFEQLIKSALITMSEKINPPEDMGSKVRNAVLLGKRKRALPYNWIFNWKKAVAVAACLTIFGGVITLAVSPGLRAWADEKANILNKIWMVRQQNDDSGTITITASEGLDSAAIKAHREAVLRNRAKASGPVSYVPYTTLAEAEREIGFKIKVPACFPDGYGLPKRIWVGEYMKAQDGKLVATGKHEVRMRFDGGNEDNLVRTRFDYGNVDSSPTLVYIISEIGMKFKPGFRCEEIKVGGRNACWYESEITLNKYGQKPQQVIERAISWEEGGMTYLLNDSTGLSKQELVRIVESIQ
ncbi:hypothetical protein SAMN02745218_01962 [Desulfofundulus australicus DSM 11792]|uniref:DUF4367 domain-containing protein n=1 Tax=Desulfofundulus australicus DSM 11792 TaxID=1121425 RepID=A0A1M5AQ86_9FIRM|nr:hypothetical protein [Desulfofundulus australicus]SHF32267.1 hypothetical protein SAMN02745218_01962 [Desulfofundulus australicus DSM 11792]